MVDYSRTTTETTSASLTGPERAKWWIEFIGFWLLGLCNNFGYVVMLSAAHDILKQDNGNSTSNDTKNVTNVLDCNSLSTGAILLADILPALAIKVTAPFFMHKIPYNIRFIFIVLFATGALVTVGLSKNLALSLFGVGCASISSGFGEITILQLTSFYSKDTVSAWSSGTGAAGLLGSFSYTGLTSLLHVNPRTAILILLFIPVLQVISYIMVGASRAVAKHRQYEPLSGSTTYDSDGGTKEEPSIPPPSYEVVMSDIPRSRAQMVKPLLKYMIPLTLVYFAEYLINQGLHELIYVRRSSGIQHSDQYRWYSVCYQLGVFLSRSSVAIIKINQLWILPIIQFINMGLFFTCVFRTEHIPSVWLIFGLVVFEGLIGGGAYVNTFYKISIEIPEADREFSMGVASVGDSFGITAAGLSAIPLHNAICDHFNRY